MRLVHRQRQTGRPTAAVGTLCVLGLAAALIVALATAGGALAGRASHADLCSASKPVAASIVSSTNFSNPTSSLSNLKNTYTKIEAAEPSLLAAASGSPYEADLKAVFPVLNSLIGILDEGIRPGTRHQQAVGLVAAIGETLRDEWTAAFRQSLQSAAR